MPKGLQAKNITDIAIIDAVQTTAPHSHRQAIIAHFPELPAKIVTAKLRQAALKKILIGCADDSCARKGKNGCSEPYRIDEARLA